MLFYQKHWAILYENYKQIEQIYLKHKLENFKTKDLKETFDASARKEIVYYSSNDNGLMAAASMNNGETGSVVVIPVVGPLFKGANLMTEYSGATSMEQVANAIKIADANKSIKSIILKIDSPGGTVDGIENLTSTILACEKPIWGFVYGMCASAAYAIGVSCDRLICGCETDIVGSVGTITTHNFDNESGLITVLRASRSEKKAMPNNSEKLNEKSIAETMKLLDGFNDWFCSLVEARMPKINKSLLDGSVLIGNAALSEGFIHGIDTFENILTKANKGKNGLAEMHENKTLDMKINKFPKLAAVLGMSINAQTVQETVTDTTVATEAPVEETTETVNTETVETPA